MTPGGGEIPGGETPVPMIPGGETPVPMIPGGETPVPILPGGGITKIFFCKISYIYKCF